MKESVLTILRTSVGVDEYPIFKTLIERNLDFVNFDDREYCWHATPNLLHKLVRRINRKSLSKNFNNQLLYYIKTLKPSYFIVFKASCISPEVVLAAKNCGSKTIAIYPDLDPAIYGDEYVLALSEFDFFYHTKPNLEEYFTRVINSRSKLIGPFFDPKQVKSILPFDPLIGVSFVGHHSPGKEQSLKEFADQYQGHLTVIGDRWKASMFYGSNSIVSVRPSLYGVAINEIYQKSICIIGLLMESISAHESSDEVTARTILVPCYGGLLLHKKTPSVSRIFNNNDDLLFDDTTDLITKIKKIESNSEYRANLASIQQQSSLLAGTNVTNFMNKVLKL